MDGRAPVMRMAASVPVRSSAMVARRRRMEAVRRGGALDVLAAGSALSVCAFTGPLAGLYAGAYAP